MGRAEQIAEERACEVVFLNTMTFQAPGFYSKLGYKVFGELTDAPRGYGRLWFCKRLRRCSGAVWASSKGRTRLGIRPPSSTTDRATVG